MLKSNVFFYCVASVRSTAEDKRARTKNGTTEYTQLREPDHRKQRSEMQTRHCDSNWKEPKPKKENITGEKEMHDTLSLRNKKEKKKELKQTNSAHSMFGCASDVIKR